MAATGRRTPVPVGERLRDEPQVFELLQALLLLERAQPHATPLGQGIDPRREAVRLRGPLTPVFSASQVAQLEFPGHAQPLLSTPVFGLGGPDGPLPYAYQEWLQQRARLKDHGPAEFLDLFQHRLLSLLYRILRKYRVAIGFVPPQASPVQDQLRALTGLLPRSLQGRQAIPDGLIVARTALFAGARRSLAGFESIVRHHFAVSVRLEQFQGAWREIPAASCSHLGRHGRNLELGRSAVAGKRVWDEHAGIRIVLGPLNGQRYPGFLPDGAAHRQLAALAAFYFGPDLDCALRLLVSETPALTLTRQAPPRAAWNSWLERQPKAQLRHINTRLTVAGSA
ncbi:type VI secretion system protein ImpH [Pseudomonas sp. SJZ079]|uniref:type VI secretion system baseplate subunit TssG n=1 Tax=Pseudomonas sp. SJZ079 TaxID=2572887 RepID=UPI00119BD8E3|nr:type VI secretion system baseplate subunit TssG [Pseudomonas sp. SJZ079]TWC40138.1 type VI secretion system protein ImpH [Pseudomonas sp. SJZ079]